MDGADDERSPLRQLIGRVHGAARGELKILLVVLLIAFLGWGLAEVADEVMEGGTHAFDRWVLLALRDPADLAVPRGPRWLQGVARDYTALGGVAVTVLLSAAVVAYLLLVRRWHAAIYVAAAVGSGWGLSGLLKGYFERSRPDVVPHLVEVSTASFPSGHALVSAVTYLTLGALLARLDERRRVKLYVLGAALFLTLLIGLTRIYLGVHWPTDVLAGWTAGTLWALLCWLLARWLQHRGAIEGTRA